MIQPITNQNDQAFSSSMNSFEKTSLVLQISLPIFYFLAKHFSYPATLRYLLAFFLFRKILSTVCFSLLYPACFIKTKNIGSKVLGLDTKSLLLKKGLCSYKAIEITRQADTKKWLLYALPNNRVIDQTYIEKVIGHTSNLSDVNLLFVNGPNLFQLTLPSATSLTNGQSIAMEYLQEKKATHIALTGLSIGALMQSQITPKRSIKCLRIIDRTFNQLSIATAEVANRWLRGSFLLIHALFLLLDIDLNMIKTTMKLSKMGLTQIIIGNSNGDGLLTKKASLIASLPKNLPNTEFIDDDSIFHAKPLPEHVNKQIASLLKDFFWSNE